jgi:signal transduction histidine kinase
LYTELARAFKEGNGLQPTASLINMVEEDLEGLDGIITMGQSMERIANDVLSLARIQLSTLEIFRVEMDLKKECTRVCSVFGNEWCVASLPFPSIPILLLTLQSADQSCLNSRLKRIHLQLDLGPTFKALIEQDRAKILVRLHPLLDFPLTWKGVETCTHIVRGHFLQTDAVRLNQVWVNLLSNSIRFTAPSSVRDIHMSIEVRFPRFLLAVLSFRHGISRPVG